MKRTLFVLIFSASAVVFLSGCQISYLLKSAYNQMALLNDRVPVEKALENPALTPEEKAKIQLSQEARLFAENELKLKTTKNYTSFVQLDRPYVNYVVSGSPKWELKHHLWNFPIVGKVPYKGYFNEPDAKAEAEELKKQNLDVYLRGVSAYSTLGWFRDPILSSMLRYRDFDLVDTIIHETVHATLYIKSSADFNERMASYLGQKGAELFYLKKEGPQSATFKQHQLQTADENLFSQFISKEIRDLEAWYKSSPPQDEEQRQNRIKEIQTRFTSDLKPKLKTDIFNKFPTLELNNARILSYKTYVQDLSDFEALFQLVKGDFAEFLKKCESLKSSEKPEEGLKELLKKAAAEKKD